MVFARTPSGQRSKYHFFPYPLVWVEGHSDVPFFANLLHGENCHIDFAGGREECMKLAQHIAEDDDPYVVVIDGDYGVLERSRSPHRRVVYLQRYSIESYLFEYEPIERIAQAFARVGPDVPVIKDRFETLVDYIENNLKDILVLDVAHERTGSGKPVLPKHVEQLLADKLNLSFDEKKIINLYSKARANISEEELDASRRLIEQFQAKKRLIHLIRGHFAFGMLKYLIYGTVQAKTHKKPKIGDEELKTMLIGTVWAIEPSPDHRNLRRRLLKAVRDTGR